MEKLTEEQMWEVIDGMATPEILQKHEQLLLADDEYKAEFMQYAFLDQQLHKLDLEVPSMRFTENVIDEVLHIKKGEKKKDWTPLIYLAAMVALSGFVGLIFSTLASSGSSTPVTDGDGFMSVLVSPVALNLFLILNIVLILAILDKKVLKPFFEKRLK